VLLSVVIDRRSVTKELVDLREDYMELPNKEYNGLGVYQQIKEAGRRLFISQGFENTSVFEVMDKLQMKENEFYQYFKTKDQLLEVIWSES